jgi:hypothetical protein
MVATALDAGINVHETSQFHLALPEGKALANLQFKLLVISKMIYSTFILKVTALTICIAGVACTLDPDDVLPWQITGASANDGPSNARGTLTVSFTVADNNALSAITSPSGSSTPKFTPSAVTCQVTNKTVVGQCDSIDSGNWTVKLLPGENQKFSIHNYVIHLTLNETVRYNGSTYWKTFVGEQEIGGTFGAQVSSACTTRGQCHTNQVRASTPALCEPTLVDCRGDC